MPVEEEDQQDGSRTPVERRSFPRPPFWLNLIVLAAAIAAVSYSHRHREEVSVRFATELTKKDDTPALLYRVKNDLAGMDLSRETLRRELDNRLKFAESLKSDQFYLSIDTKEKKLRLYYGPAVIREAEVQVGAAETVAAGEGRSWTFVPPKGAFTVTGKSAGHVWRLPEWLYARNRQPMPPAPPSIRHGLGKYVVFLPDNYVIHSPPAEESPLDGPKPGSFLVAEEDLKALWPRLRKKTPVYIF